MNRKVDELLQLSVRGGLRDCWNQIGVQGDRSCPELARHVHCRNCPTYRAGAEALLERELAAEELELRTRRFAEPSPREPTDLLSLLIFRLAAEWLALPTRAVESVLDARPVHSLPHRRNGVVLGVANVRGELVVCVSLARLLGGEQTAPRPAERARERLLVLRRGASRFVARVDEVHGTQRCARDALRRAPETVSRSAATYSSMVLTWAERSVGCLDDARLFAALERSLT